MNEYCILYKPVYKHKEETDTRWRFVGRNFVSIRSAIRYARVNKIFCYSIYKGGKNSISDALYIRGHKL